MGILISKYLLVDVKLRIFQAVGTTKKCYMLYDVVADESLTGGTFYSDQQLDSQFVETLAHICVAMLQVNFCYSCLR